MIFLFLTRSRHKNMFSLKFVDERQLFKATTKLVDCGTQLYSLKSESWVKRSHQKETESIHGNEWMEMNWTLYVWRHPTILSVFKWNACFLNACFPCVNVKIFKPCKRKGIFFSSLEGAIKLVIIQTERVSCIWIHICALLGKIKYRKFQWIENGCL